MLVFTSARLQMHEVTEDNLADVLPIYLSNPEVVKRMEGSEGEEGRYDLERWQRDWYLAQMMPGHHMLLCYLKADHTPVGFIDYLEEHEDDGKPWLGQLMIHHDYQRQGLASEAFQSLAQYCHKHYDWPLLRAWAMEHNMPALAFLQHVGFQPTGQAPKQWRLSGGIQQFMVFERSLSD